MFAVKYLTESLPQVSNIWHVGKKFPLRKDFPSDESVKNAAGTQHQIFQSKYGGL